MDGLPLTVPAASRRLAAAVAAAAACAAFLPAASQASVPDMFTGSSSAEFELQAAAARYRIVEEGDKDGVLRRLGVLDDGYQSLADALGDLAYAAQTLRERADLARLRGQSDDYFTFDLNAFHDLVWRRRAEAVLDLEEIQRLLLVADPDSDVSRRAAQAARTALAAAQRADDLSVVARSLEDSAEQAGGDLLGDGAADAAGLCAQDAADVAAQVRLGAQALARLAQRTAP